MKLNMSEERYEEEFERALLDQGYVKASPNQFDRQRNIDIDTLISFIEKTQPRALNKFKRVYESQGRSEPFEKVLYDAFESSVRQNGILKVLRKGFKANGTRFEVFAKKPIDNRNPSAVRDYEENVFQVIRQYKYAVSNENEIDLVLAVNGIPLIAIELKNQFTGQDVYDAMEQWRTKRDPKQLGFNHRFLAFFAVDQTEAYMTTKLEKKDTYFLPFNQGSNGSGNPGGKGNPPGEDGEHITSYLWDKVFTKDGLTDIIQEYITLDRHEKKVIDRYGKETTEIQDRLIFPRYHQLDAISKLIDVTKQEGRGHNRLIMHSAGSGKTYTISWLAYQLKKLKDENNNPLFDSVIVLTHRKVLNQQLSNCIRGLNDTDGYVQTIDDRNASSSDLDEALVNGKPIITTTIQKFPFLEKFTESNEKRNFAVIIDEAHESQSGELANKIKEVLGDTDTVLEEAREADLFQAREDEDQEEEDIDSREMKRLRDMARHGKQPNMSYFTFTATPKDTTLELYGEKQEDGTYKPFHTYSMRQAIEEGFILDVLKNYTTYETAYRLSTNSDEELPKSEATRKIRQYASLHPENITQKAEIMLDHFLENVRPRLKGKAKAMVVTASRQHAYYYTNVLRALLKSRGLDDLGALVAFSGKLTDKDTGVEFTESDMNGGISEEHLPEEFHKDNNGILVVADKYQTGFDEPLLVGMYVDKELHGVRAVQTLSRLNRCYKGKTDTFIIDFANSSDDILEAFQPYYQEVSLNEGVDINHIYQTFDEIRDFGLYDEATVEKFDEIYYSEQDDNSVAQITNLIHPVIRRYLDLNVNDRFKFTKAIRNFNRWYAYITQIVRLFDDELEAEYHFTKVLDKFLPPAETREEEVDLDDMIRMTYFRLDTSYSGSISLREEMGEFDGVGKGSREARKEPVKESISAIVDEINDQYNAEFTDADRVVVETLREAILRRIRKEGTLVQAARLRSKEEFMQSYFSDVFEDEAYNAVDLYTKLFSDAEFFDAVKKTLGENLYDILNRETP